MAWKGKWNAQHVKNTNMKYWMVLNFVWTSSNVKNFCEHRKTLHSDSFIQRFVNFNPNLMTSTTSHRNRTMSRNPLDIMQTFSSKLLTYTALQLPSQRYCYKANMQLLPTIYNFLMGWKMTNYMKQNRYKLCAREWNFNSVLLGRAQKFTLLVWIHKTFIQKQHLQFRMVIGEPLCKNWTVRAN